MAPALSAAGHRFFAHPDVGALYPAYLCASHAVVRASVPLMQAAVGSAPAAGDAVAEPLVRYLERHIVEEASHDEWLLTDLEALGIDRSTVLARPPSPAVAALVGAQYYWIRHYHPIALLGYMAVLEGSPPTPEQVELLIRRTGLPRRAFRTLIEHAELDPGHGDEIFGLLDELRPGEDHSTVVGTSAMHTVAALAAVIDGVVDGWEGVASVTDATPAGPARPG